MGRHEHLDGEPLVLSAAGMIARVQADPGFPAKQKALASLGDQECVPLVRPRSGGCAFQRVLGPRPPYGHLMGKSRRKQKDHAERPLRNRGGSSVLRPRGEHRVLGAANG